MKGWFGKPMKKSPMPFLLAKWFAVVYVLVWGKLRIPSTRHGSEHFLCAQLSWKITLGFFVVLRYH